MVPSPLNETYIRQTKTCQSIATKNCAPQFVVCFDKINGNGSPANGSGIRQSPGLWVIKQIIKDKEIYSKAFYYVLNIQCTHAISTQNLDYI
jgi:hypothetical protein